MASLSLSLSHLKLKFSSHPWVYHKCGKCCLLVGKFLSWVESRGNPETLMLYEKEPDLKQTPMVLSFTEVVNYY